ncbi:DNA-binding domain-containing protein [Mitsuaria sp. GD03876]|uniref:HvfC/BufC N-terminal domain-containing protein n=1 Tax=Mitsuaria sp. GD03876 TaxID=2975399 RepID=UPI002446E965|nr:DNA-binding domain-containing protein [Mitsuaria sp. GD03876]MDH0866896.1 DNA-binding domain-containing protein [Mitsuaria sp. GD03876]
MTLVEFQEAFWRDLWADADPAAPRPAAFKVYRNTVLKGCADALVSLYPAVHRLTGDAWMQAVALDHARLAPPTGGDLQHYGERFPAFLDQALADSDLPWLGEVARLDRLWSDSHVAADAPMLGLREFAALAQAGDDRLARSRLVPHPAARWHWSAGWPAFSLWRAARDAADDPNPSHWDGEGALMTRPAGAVRAHPIDAAEAALLDACADGMPLGAALDAVQARFPDFDPGAALGRLLDHGAFTAVTEMSS